jgi:hypothetical protein
MNEQIAISHCIANAVVVLYLSLHYQINPVIVKLFIQNIMEKFIHKKTLKTFYHVLIEFFYCTITINQGMFISKACHVCKH